MLLVDSCELAGKGGLENLREHGDPILVTLAAAHHHPVP